MVFFAGKKVQNDARATDKREFLYSLKDTVIFPCDL